VYEPSTTSGDGVSIGEPRNKRVQTDLDERVTGEWSEQEVAVQSVGSSIVPAQAVRGCTRSIAEERLVQIVDRRHGELLEGGSSDRVAASSVSCT
jgi:hypothetical protein